MIDNSVKYYTIASFDDVNLWRFYAGGNIISECRAKKFHSIESATAVRDRLNAIQSKYKFKIKPHF